MDAHYATIDAPATPEYVLAVLQDQHRQQCGFDSAADPAITLTFDTTVDDWRDACDLLEWPALGYAENQLWGLACSAADWRNVLEPAHQKRLAGVCALIARHAVQPRIRPARLLGRACTPAGAFLTIRSLLARAGAPAAEIAPSTPLAEFTRRYPHVFLYQVSRLAPGALPPVRIHTPLHDAATRVHIVSLAGLIVGLCGGWTYLTAACGLLAATSYALTWIAPRCVRPASVQLGDLKTFRDLALVITGGDISGRPRS